LGALVLCRSAGCNHCRRNCPDRRSRYTCSKDMVAVGKRVTPLPPRRSRRALLTHRAPPSGRTSDGERFGPAHRPAHNRQLDRRRYPALCPDRGRLTAVPLGPGPSLHVLRRKSPSIVRSLLRYCGPVRLLTHVHVQRAAYGLPEPARTKVRARVRSPRFRTKDVSTCMGSPTAQGPSHTRPRTHEMMLPSLQRNEISTSEFDPFRSSIPSPWSPL